MKQFIVDLEAYFRVSVVVEADNADDAWDVAQNNYYAGKYDSSIKEMAAECDPDGCDIYVRREV